MRDRDEIIASWALEQMVGWLTRPAAPDSVLADLQALCDDNTDLFLYTINRGTVYVAPKVNVDKHPWSNDIPLRVEVYRNWLEFVARTLCPDLVITLALCVGDRAVEKAAVPVFGFQKPRGHNNVLLPDIDLLRSDFEPPTDTLKFLDKRTHAVFVGSTSGGWITMEALRKGDLTPRLEASRFFSEHLEVTFKLPVICQYDSAETASHLQMIGLGDGVNVSWQTMLDNKFIFSMDGNGPTCSRIRITLGSKSVLLKYKSTDLLYYFTGLQPWLHFIPIDDFADVVEITRLEARSPGLFEPIVKAANVFNARFLTKGAVMTYTARVLGLYAQWLGHGDRSANLG